jgi:hypothetical protein
VTFQETLTAAVKDFTIHGYSDALRLQKWMKLLRDAALAEMPSSKNIDDRVKAALNTFYWRALSAANIKRRHPDIPRFTVERIKPQLRSELTRRILASADLIKLNRSQAVEKTLQRFSGWATSIPEGGSLVVDKVDVKADVSKSLRQVKYEERRCVIDQGHKLVSSINTVIAHEGGALAGKWRDYGSVQPGYDARHKHMERNGKYYAIRGNWAIEKGLMNKGDGYTDEMTAPSEEVFCRCWFVFAYNLRDLPADMLTVKGRKALEAVRIAE